MSQDAGSPPTLDEFRALDLWFERIIDSSDPGEALARVLEEIDADQPHLREPLMRLVQADAGHTWTWEDGSLSVLDRPTEVALADGDELGPWTVCRELGRGGMGVVYEVERAHRPLEGQEFVQRAALKVLTTRLGARGLRSRLPFEGFMREMSTLAELGEHPHIAQFIDAGVLAEPSPLPYFVMEYVEGLPLDEWCEAQSASVEVRMTLVQQVLRALHFMHVRGVVHRDIKPQNILVSDTGHPKILDLGIAQVERRVSTSAFTPGWSSPEQRAGEEVTVASDVYNAGLLCWALLTGERFEGEAPSLRAWRVASSRSRRDARGVSEELDAVVARALAPVPEERYASARAMADDLKRALDGDVVDALREDRGYLLRYALGRYRGVVFAAALVVLMIGGWSVSVTFQNRVIERERNAAVTARELAEREAAASRELVNFMEGLFSSSDPTLEGARGVSAEEVLDRASASMLEEQTLSASTRARMLRVMGSAYLGLGDSSKAAPLLEQLAGEDEALACGGGAEALEHASALFALARLRFLEGKSVEAKTLFERFVHECGGGPAEDGNPWDVMRIEARALLSDITYWNLHHADESLEHLEAILRMTEGVTQKELVASRIHALVRSADLRRLDAEGYLAHKTEALELAARIWGEYHPKRALLYGNLVFIAADTEERISWARRSIEINEHVYGPKHVRVAARQNDLALVLDATGHLDEAIEVMTLALEGFEANLPVEHELCISGRNNLGALLRERGDLKRAEALFMVNLPLASKLLHTLSNIAQLRAKQGRFEEAVALNERALAIIDRGEQGGPSHTRVLMERLARLHMRVALVEASASASDP